MRTRVSGNSECEDTVPDFRRLWAVVEKLNIEGRSSTPVSVASLVTGAFHAFESDPGLLDLFALVSLHSRRDEREWISLRGMPSTRDRELLLEASAAHAKGEPAHVEALGAWVIIHAIGPSLCIAVFEDRATAAAGAEEIATLADVLRMGLATQRRLENGRLMAQLAFAPSQKGSPRDALHGAMAAIAGHMRADGAKVYLYRRNDGCPCLEIFSRTDGSPVQSLKPYPISSTHGLADWVVLRDDWLIIDDSVAPKDVTVKPEHCRTGKCGGIDRLGRPGREQDPGDPTGDRERVFLLVPMREQDRVVGVLSFWRMTDDTFDPDLDLASAEYLGARLAPICQSILATEVRDAVARELAKLGEMVAMAGNPRDIYARVVASAGSLARGARALLFLADERGKLYGTAEWTAGRATAQPGVGFFSIDGDFASWTDAVPKPVAEQIEGRNLGYRVRARALMLPSPVGTATARAGVVFVLDRIVKVLPPTADEGLAEHEASLFLQQLAPIVLGSYPNVFAASVGRRLRETIPIDLGSPQWASDVADKIREAIGADAVLIYQGEDDDFKVTGSSNGHHALNGLTAVGASLTRRCITTGCHKLIPDTADWQHQDAKELDRKTISKIAIALGWTGVRSWYCHPVLSDGRCRAAIKLLTRNGGTFLEPRCVEIVAAIAEHIGRGMARHYRTDVLDHLNRLAEKLTGKEGAALASAMLEELERWAHQFVRKDCRVVVMASLHAPRASVFVASRSIDPDAFEESNANQFADLMTVIADELVKRSAPFSLPNTDQRAHQLAVCIKLGSNPLLRGCLLFISDQPLHRQARTAAQEASREIAILLDYEQRSRLRIEQAARFRHALLGPVQGLINQAGEINRLIKRGDVTPDKLKGISTRIKSEATSVGLWRETQRLYSASEVKVVLRRCSLRPLVERCIERFREPILEERSSKLQLDFRPAGAVQIEMDEAAIDLVLNNLLDNARKYCFAHTTVTVTVTVDSFTTNVHVIVEDIGHGIPDRLKTRIYEVGERLDWDDRVRSITGTGLGLPISKALIEKHRGNLFHECVPGISPSDPQRCRVRFIMELPSGWR
jgi:signal transduction histidine kinase